MNVGFSINQYDEDGDMFDECVLLHIDNTILRFNNTSKLKEFRDKINKCINEIDGIDELMKGEV